MNAALVEDRSGLGAILPSDLRYLRIMLGLAVALGLSWGVSLLFFARQIGVRITAWSLTLAAV